MTLLSVERIKLFSTRAPYWCLAAILAAALLFALMIGLLNGGESANILGSQAGLQLGMIVFMVLATLAITTEYQFSTIKVSFLAVPKRASVLIAKTALLVVLAAVTAAICAFAAFFLTKALAASSPEPLELTTGTDWRMVLGNVALFPIAAVIAVAVGTLIRQFAGAITILLVWPLLVESLIQLIPNVGIDISQWTPFNAGSRFISPEGGAQGFGGVFAAGGPSPIQGLLVFIATAVILWVAALIVLLRRDA